jgi:Tfp pilus assembly protein PilF
MKLFSSMVITVALFGAAGIAQADSTREAPAPKPAVTGVTLASAQQKIDAGDYRGAIPILTDIIKADPNNADALNLMGFSLRNTGQTDLALQYYTRALALMPKHLGANEYLGELYVELSQMDKAKERLGVLQAACGNCDQEVHLAAAIAKGPGTKAGTWR